MAYLDQKTQTNRRALTALAVALLQGGAIVAVIHGLSVTIMPREPEPRLAAEQWKLDPPPPPQTDPKIEPKRDPKPNETRVDTPERRIPLPSVDDSFIEIPLPPLPKAPEWTELPVPPPAPPPATPELAQPRNSPGGWITTNDYPSRDLREGNQGLARFVLTIGTDGRVEACTITQSTGFRGLDEATCKYVSSRARFRPASDGSGRKVTGSYSGSVRWVIPQ
ncbi:MAG: TonB family protein [Novosphingobium sp.]|nr:TonB family protein [Novosphingobium sp.]MCP5401618.1 TonB family protein [Novosphingobium sp.]